MFRSLSGSTGYLVVGTTTVQLTANLVGTTFQGATFLAGNKYSSHTIFVEQHPSNTSNLYLMDRTTAQGANPTTGVGVLKTLTAPFLADTTITGLSWVAFTIPCAPGGLNASDYYLVADSASQKATVSVLRA